MKVAIIPARGGSKRILRKNIEAFCGKPIIAYSIEAATKSACFDQIIVSTDDRETVDVAMQYGDITTHSRSAKNADDHATIADVILEVMESLAKEEVYPDHLCCIFATAPFVTGEDLALSYRLLLDHGFSGVFPVVEFSYPIQRSLKFDEKNNILMTWPEYLSSRSQDLPNRYHDAGQYYWVESKAFIEEKTLFVKNATAIPISAMVSQDIDTRDDWLIAEMKYQAFIEAKRAS